MCNSADIIPEEKLFSPILLNQFTGGAAEVDILQNVIDGRACLHQLAH